MRHLASKHLTGLLLLCGLLPAVGSVAGCNRAYYRKQADEEVRILVSEKAANLCWDDPNFSIEMDPRSRFYDPYDPDRPPMPPDDPLSHQFMHCVDGKKGYKRWHRDGDLLELENPGWRAMIGTYAELTPTGAIKLGLSDAVRVAMINSSDYQQQLETLYLSALDVSTERFRFDVQFFGGNDTNFVHQGRLNPGGETNTLTNSSDLIARRKFATAGELLVGFANSMVWQFAGPNTNFTTSLLNFNFIQPLLRGGGKVVALEQLTIVERGLLANLRTFERYRQGFYTNIALGESGVSSLQRQGGFFGGTGLTGFTGQGSAGFGGVGDATGQGRLSTGGGGTGGGGGTTGFAGGGAGTVGGFIGLLQQAQQIRNAEASLNAQLRTLALLEANLDAGLIDIAQVDQFRQNIETERATLLQSRNAYENSLEAFKISQLALPPELEVELDDAMIRQFRFISAESNDAQVGIADLRDRFGELPAEPSAEQLRGAIKELAGAIEQIQQQFTVVGSDLREMQSRSEARKVRMSPAEVESFNAEQQRLLASYRELELAFTRLAEQAQSLDVPEEPAARGEVTDQLVGLGSSFSGVVEELALVQARSRLESVVLEPVDLEADQAVSIARSYRLDWMNNRAALVDTWRLIAFNANALESVLNITFSGDLGTVGDNPVKFRGPTGSLSAGLQFDAPFTRLLERNNFRQQLIEYQRDRRQLVRYEDSVKLGLRQLLRQLDQLELNLEIQRRAVAIAVRRVDQTRETLNRPPPPSQPGQPTAQFGPTAALNLLTALSDLRASQNNFMSVYLNYHANRMRLMRELGVMRIDEQGLWIEEPLESALAAAELHAPLPPEIPQEWLDGLGVVLPEPAEADVREGISAGVPADAPTLVSPPVEPLPAPKPVEKQR